MNTFHPSLFETNSINRENLTTDLSFDINTSVDLNQDGYGDIGMNENEISGNSVKYALKNLDDGSPLAFAFFSKRNIDNLQNIIKHIVYKNTGYTIDKQSYNELLVVMRSIYIDYHKHPDVFNDKMTSDQRAILSLRYQKEIARLNEVVINMIVPKIVSQLQQYVDYLRDSNNNTQIDRPEFSTIKGEREYRSITEVLLGSQL